MVVVEIIETFKTPHTVVTRIQFVKGIEPKIDDIFITSTGRKIRITGVELSISGDEKQQENWQKQRARGVFGCSFEYID